MVGLPDQFTASYPEQSLRASDAPTGLTLRLLSNSMADELRIGGDIFGSALQPANGEYGVVANVYADRARALVIDREFEATLGRVMAHELGHLLLGKNAHSAAGIMRAQWRAQDLVLAQAAMPFLPGEAKSIQKQVKARTIVDSSRLMPSPVYRPCLP